MQCVLLALLLSLAAPGMFGQVFPHIEDAELKRSGGESVEDEPDDKPDEGMSQEEIERLREAFAAAVDTVAVRNAQNASIANGRAFLRDIDRKKGRELIEDYLEGRLRFACEDWSGAVSKLKRAEPVEIKPEDGHPAPALALHRQVQNGTALELLYYSEMMEEFDISRDVELQRSTWDRSVRDFESNLEDLADIVRDAAEGENLYTSQPSAEAYNRCANAMEEGKSAWVDAREAYKAALDESENPRKVWQFAQACTAGNGTPMNLHARLALKFLIQEFPNFSEVKNGNAALVYAQSYSRTFETETAIAELKKAADRASSPDVRKKLIEASVEMENLLDTFKKNFF